MFIIFLYRFCYLYFTFLLFNWSTYEFFFFCYRFVALLSIRSQTLHLLSISISQHGFLKRNPIFTHHIGQYWIESSFPIQYSVFRIFYSICICIYISLIITILSFRFVELHIFSSRRIYICCIIFWKTGYVSSFIIGIELIPSILYTLKIIYILSKTFILFY